MTTVACVLRSGGAYDIEWVYALKRGVNAHLPEHRFICLTDVPAIPTVWARPLRHSWPKWWAKLELFRPGLFDGPVLYMDLDTLVVGSLVDLASYRGDLAMMTGFYKDGTGGRPYMQQSGVMAWTPGPATQRLWQQWMRAPNEHMDSHRGDGAWLDRHVQADRLMELYPGQIVSYKVHARDGVPGGARLVCGHGVPRFNDPKAGWAHRHWRSLTHEPPA